MSYRTLRFIISMLGGEKKAGDGQIKEGGGQIIEGGRDKGDEGMSRGDVTWEEREMLKTN